MAKLVTPTGELYLNSSKSNQLAMAEEAMGQIIDFGFVNYDYTLKSEIHLDDKDIQRVHIDVTLKFTESALITLMQNQTRVTFLPTSPSSNDVRRLSFTTWRILGNSITFHLI